MKTRCSLFYNWEAPKQPLISLRGAKIGSGKYGTVYRCKDRPYAVIKEVTASKKKNTTACRLAFREHVVAILQSIIVLKSLCPHFVIHYGVQVTSPSNSTGLEIAYFMEGFDCSLENVSIDVLATPSDWCALIFQVCSALVTAGMLLGVAHNDLYPRNILLRRRARTDAETLAESTYDIFGDRWQVPWRYLAVLTDFGICSGKLLGTPDDIPEVGKHLTIESPGVNFGEMPPSVHVLHYKELPPFSRDPYMLFKWAKYRTKSLPCAPYNVVQWASHCLAFLDKHAARHFFDSSGTQRLMSHAFSAPVLKSFALPSLSIDDDTTPIASAVSLKDKEDVFNDGRILMKKVDFSSHVRRSDDDKKR